MRSISLFNLSLARIYLNSPGLIGGDSDILWLLSTAAVTLIWVWHDEPYRWRIGLFFVPTAPKNFAGSPPGVSRQSSFDFSFNQDECSSDICSNVDSKMLPSVNVDASTNNQNFLFRVVLHKHFSVISVFVFSVCMVRKQKTEKASLPERSWKILVSIEWLGKHGYPQHWAFGKWHVSSTCCSLLQVNAENQAAGV